MRITRSQIRRIIRERVGGGHHTSEPDLYVVIANAGRGRQSMWPKSEEPGVYSKEEAEAIAKQQNRDSRSMGFGGSIHYHAQPLSRDLLGGRFGVSPGNEAYIGLTKLIQDYEAGGQLSNIRESIDLDLTVMPGDFVTHPKLGVGIVDTYVIDDFGRLTMAVELAKTGKIVDARNGETDGHEWKKETFKDYSPLAVELASEATLVVNYPQGAAIENEIHALLDSMPHIGDDERWEVADEALSVAGIMLGVGPDAL